MAYSALPTRVDGTDPVAAADVNQLQANIAAMTTGWIDAEETWTYASADGPTFTFTISGDKTTKYSAGMKIKLTQTTVKYFIITAVSYSSPNTTVTIYGGTDYTLDDAAISNVYYSAMKAPHGFPPDPAKWTVEVTDATTRQQTSPTGGTWYNLGNVNISIPIGLWDVKYSAPPLGAWSGNAFDVYITLSTSTNSESDSDFTCYVSGYGYIGANVSRDKRLSVSSKTSYYIITKTSNAITGLYNMNARSKLILRAVCAYL